jgi:hypothetical protein
VLKGDDLLKEFVFNLSRGYLVEAEPSSRASAITTAMEDVSADEFAEIMSPVQTTRTRRTNKFFAHLAAYTVQLLYFSRRFKAGASSSHANPAYERDGSANSVLSGGTVTDTTPLATGEPARHPESLRASTPCPKPHI